MEAKLAEYRERKLKEQRLKENASKGFFSFFRRAGTTNSKPKEDESSSTEISTSKEQEDKDPNNDDVSECDTEENTEPPPPQKFSRLLFVLKIAMWCTVWLIFIELQFGAVFFAISALAFVYFNTRTGKRKGKDSLSAYSVFNPNCERLQGTITAEQLEGELLYRKPLSPS